MTNNNGGQQQQRPGNSVSTSGGTETPVTADSAPEARILTIDPDFKPAGLEMYDLDTFLSRCDVETQIRFSTRTNTPEEAEQLADTCFNLIQEKIGMTMARVIRSGGAIYSQAQQQPMFCVVFNALDIVCAHMCYKLKWPIILGGLENGGMCHRTLQQARQHQKFIWIPYWNTKKSGLCCYRYCGKIFPLQQGYFYCQQCTKSFYCSNQCYESDRQFHFAPPVSGLAEDPPVCQPYHVSAETVNETMTTPSLYMLCHSYFYYQLTQFCRPVSPSSSSPTVSKSTEDDGDADMAPVAMEAAGAIAVN